MTDTENRLKEMIASGASTDDILKSFDIDSSSLSDDVRQLMGMLIAIISALTGSVDKMNSNVEYLMDAVDKLTKTIADKKTNSRTSSKPPSSDGYNRKDRSLRKSTGRPSGGQKGHEGHGLKKVAADEVREHDHYPSQCTSCPNLASCIRMMSTIRSGHVYEVETVVIDNVHKAYSIVCPMTSRLLRSSLPEDVRSSQQFGSSIKAFIVDQWTIGITSISRICEMARIYLGQKISEGTVMKVLAEFSHKCGDISSAIREYLRLAPVKGADETGMRTGTKLHWLHTVCNDRATYLYADAKRGFDAIEREGLLIDATGALIHDCWSPYFRLENVSHAICLQHIQRELRGAALRERDHAEYFDRIEKFLLLMRKAKLDAIEAGLEGLDSGLIAELKKKFKILIDEGLSIFKPPKRCRLKLGKIPEGKTRSLLLRLDKHIDTVFMFLENFDIEFSNNLSEQSLRGAKVRQSVSKCFRTEGGLAIYAHITSVLDTARKNGISRLDMIRDVFAGTAKDKLAAVLV